MAHVFRVLVAVTDIEKAAQFYSTVLDQPGERVSPGRHYFNCDGVILACVDPIADGDGYEATPNPESLYLAVHDLLTTFQACGEAGAVFPTESPPEVGPLGRIAVRPWGEESFYIRDPFGNQLCFVSEGTIFTGSPTV